MSSQSKRSLRHFTGEGYDKGRPLVTQLAWLTVSGALFMRWWCPNTMRVWILRAFGARVGSNVLIRQGVKIHWPWKLDVGNSSWIGEGAWILNLEPVIIGQDVCVSQNVFICTGSHDFRSPTFEFDNAPIVIEDGVWLAAKSTVLRGVRIGENSLIGATVLIRRDVPAASKILATRADGAPNL